MGVPLGHSLLAIKSTKRGLGKMNLNPAAMDADLDANWAVVAEALQTVLRREAYPSPYEALKDLTRVPGGITQSEECGVWANSHFALCLSFPYFFCFRLLLK